MSWISWDAGQESEGAGDLRTLRIEIAWVRRGVVKGEEVGDVHGAGGGMVGLLEVSWAGLLLSIGLGAM